MGRGNRKYLITGGSSGLGFAAAQSLVAEGADIAICGRSQERIDQAVKALETPGQDIVGFRADVTGPDAFGQLREELTAHWVVCWMASSITPAITPREV